MHLFLLIASDPSPRSSLPLIAQLQHEGGNAHPVHPQTYKHPGTHRELQGGSSFLSTANTRPIRFALDFKSLYEEFAPEYSACFRAHTSAGAAPYRVQLI